MSAVPKNGQHCAKTMPFRGDSIFLARANGILIVCFLIYSFIFALKTPVWWLFLQDAQKRKISFRKLKTGRVNVGFRFRHIIN